MAKGVLGNDPFLRGAASRENEEDEAKPADKPAARGSKGRAPPPAKAQKAQPAAKAKAKQAKAPKAKAKPAAPSKSKVSAKSPPKRSEAAERRPSLLDQRAEESLRQRISTPSAQQERATTAHPPAEKESAAAAAEQPAKRTADEQRPGRTQAETGTAAEPTDEAELDARRAAAEADAELADDSDNELETEREDNELDAEDEAADNANAADREVDEESDEEDVDEDVEHDEARAQTPEALTAELVFDEEEEDEEDPEPTSHVAEGELLAEQALPPEDRLAPAPFDPSMGSKTGGVLALARDIFVQALDRPPFRAVAQSATGLMEVVRTAAGLTRSDTLDDFGKDEALEEALEPLTRFFFERYWRVNVEAPNEVPEGRCLLVANHSGALPFDGPVLAEALKRERPDLEEPRWLVEDQVFHAPFLGTLLNRLGAIRASPENAVRLLDEGRPVIVFPEGIQGMGKPYRERYQLKRFGRGGFAKLAMRTNTPIVPVAIVGAEETMPMLARLPGKFFGFPYLPLTPLGPIPLPARWSIRFGEPLHPSTSGAGAETDLAEVHRLTERTRESIDAMLKAQLSDRKSIYF